MFQELIKKYIRRPAVQRGIVAQITKSIAIKMIHCNSSIICEYNKEIITIKNVDHEDKIQLYLRRPTIITLVQKKLLEQFGINAIIKDIKLN